MSQKQFEQTMEMMRKACITKSGATAGNYRFIHFSLLVVKLKKKYYFCVCIELVDGFGKGVFPDPEVKELKCYTLCITQMSGTVS